MQDYNPSKIISRYSRAQYCRFQASVSIKVTSTSYTLSKCTQRSLKFIISDENHSSQQFFEILCYDQYPNWFMYLYGMTHVKVYFIPVLKMWVSLILGRFIWTPCFVQCGSPCKYMKMYIVLPLFERFLITLISKFLMKPQDTTKVKVYLQNLRSSKWKPRTTEPCIEKVALLLFCCPPSKAWPSVRKILFSKVDGCLWIPNHLGLFFFKNVQFV